MVGSRKTNEEKIDGWFLASIHGGSTSGDAGGGGGGVVICVVVVKD